MKTIARIIKHLFTTTHAGKRAFPPTALQAIEQAISRSEARHRAEIRLIIEPALPLSATLQRIAPRDRARQLFLEYGVWDTEENCGILIYINLADRKVEIIADRMAGRLIDAREWQTICDRMTQGFACGKFCDSTIAGLEYASTLLERYFPATGERSNQLADQPMIL